MRRLQGVLGDHPAGQPLAVRPCLARFLCGRTCESHERGKHETVVSIMRGGAPRWQTGPSAPVRHVHTKHIIESYINLQHVFTLSADTMQVHN